MTKYLFVLFVSIAFFACDREEPAPIAEELVLKPTRFEEEDYSKVFSYDEAGRLARISMISKFPNGGEMISHQDFTYDENGQLKESTTDTGWRVIYHFVNGELVRADEVVNGSPSQYHTYSYDGQDRLIESITWQNIPEEGGEIKTARDTYEYDSKGNLLTQRLFYFGPRGETMYPLTTFTFSGYDDKINSESYFDVHPFNPTVRGSKNNPGKMIVANARGVISVTETYTYQYHENGYATAKSTHVTQQDGASGSYQSRYFFTSSN